MDGIQVQFWSFGVEGLTSKGPALEFRGELSTLQVSQTLEISLSEVTSATILTCVPNFVAVISEPVMLCTETLTFNAVGDDLDEVERPAVSEPIVIDGVIKTNAKDIAVNVWKLKRALAVGGAINLNIVFRVIDNLPNFITFLMILKLYIHIGIARSISYACCENKRPL
jgi:hypothetical protein